MGVASQQMQYMSPLHPLCARAPGCVKNAHPQSWEGVYNGCFRG